MILVMVVVVITMNADDDDDADAAADAHTDHNVLFLSLTQRTAPRPAAVFG